MLSPAQDSAPHGDAVARSDRELAAEVRDEPTYAINQDLKFRREDTHGGPRMVRVEVHAAGGSRFYMIPEEVVEALRLFDGRRDVDEVLDAIRERNDMTARTLCSRERLTQFVTSFCLPNRLLISSHDHGTETPPANRARYVHGRVPLIPHWIVYPIARSLSGLFSKQAAVLVLTASALAHAALYFFIVPAYHVSVAAIGASQVGQVIALAILAAMWHEFGHATALARHGCSRLEIGLAWYIQQPVFYTDVSEAWRLAARQRAVVDVGGIYFHAMCALPLVALFAMSDNLVYVYAAISVDLAIVLSLNPLFRMDGYWLLGDLFGLWSPRRQCYLIVRRVWRHWRREGVWERLSAREAGLVAYVGASVGAFTYLTIVIAGQVITEILPVYPHDVLAWLTSLRDLDRHSIGSTLEMSGTLFWRTMLLYVCGITVYRGGRAITKHVPIPRRFLQ
jgi:putative peptide zinc metalloprotease protein